MSIVRITESILGDIADAIREKKNTSDTFTPTEMADEISSIETGVSPITVNITQSEHQTITATATATSSQLPVVNGQISTPTAITVYASIEATDAGYVPGTLNQTSVVANWGDTVSFSATPAIQYVPFSITLNVDPSSYTSEVSGLGDSYLTYSIAGVSFTLIPGQTVTHYVPPGQSYNVTLRSLNSFDWYASNSQISRLQGNTGSGDSISLTLVKKTGTIYLQCTYYTDGTNGTCSYSGTVDGISVSGTVLGQNNTTITDVYYGSSYNITFTNPPSGFVFSNGSSVYNVNGTTPTSRDYLRIPIMLMSTGPVDPVIEIPDLEDPL